MNRFIAFLTLSLLVTVWSCTKETFDNASEDGNKDVVEFTIGGDSNDVKSSTGAPETFSGVVADLSESSGIEGLKLVESITDLDEMVYDVNSETKGTPVYTENFTDIYYTNGFIPAAVYAGTTKRDDLKSTFKPVSGKDRTFSCVYHVEWPKDRKVLYYFEAPDTMPNYVGARTYTPASKSVKFALTAANYPTTATAQKDILLTSKEITVVPGGKASDNVLFYHVFTGVKFRLGNTDAVTKITKVEMTNMLASGTCTLTPNYPSNVTTSNPLASDNSNAATKSAACAVWSHPESTVTRKTFSQTYDAKVDCESGYFDESFYGGNSDNANLATSSTDTKATTTFWCIPQKFSTSDANHVQLTISYTIDGGKTTKTSVVDFTKALNGKEWKAGQLYTYTLQVNDFGVTVTDSVSGLVKSNVKITNTGNTTEYVRAAIVGNWMKNDATKGLVIVAPWTKAEGTFTGLFGTDWWYNEADGFYYYKKAIKGGNATKNALFTKYTAVSVGIDGAYLQMSIIAQAVPYESNKQSVIDAWGSAVATQLTTTIE